MPKGIYPHKKGYKRQPFSIEWRENMGKSQRVKVVSEITKSKIRATMKLKGLKPPMMTSELKEKLMRIHLGSKQSAETIEKRVSHFRGEKSSHYIKDRTQLKHRFGDERRSSIYSTWRNDVRKIDNWKCKINNKDCEGRLEVHHILGFVEHPELRYDINNGITLCRFHHPRKRIDEMKLSPYFQELVATR